MSCSVAVKARPSWERLQIYRKGCHHNSDNYVPSKLFYWLSHLSQLLRLIIYTGKGGTGKTVTSCATAMKMAELGYRTLVISADPAHTLSDAFMMQDITYDPIQVLPNLTALQIDPVTEMSKQYDPILSYMAAIFSAKGIDETLAYEIAMLPGMTQLFSLLKIEEVERAKSHRPAHIDDLVLLIEQGHDRVGASAIEFRRVGPF